MEELAAQGSSTEHFTDFLTSGCRTHLIPGLPPAARHVCLEALRERGYQHVYVYAYNEDDYGGPSFDHYQRPQTLVALLLEIRERGLLPILWLFPDDAPDLARESVAELTARLDALVPVVDPLVDSYVLGLELDEYWEAPRVDSLGSHLRGLTSRSIGVHQRPGRWELAHFPWVDVMILQYGFGRTQQDIRDMTIRAIGELGKPVVAGEYELEDELRARSLGDVAVAAGAAGFGNGGTVLSARERRE